jgi:hypothetical protein
LADHKPSSQILSSKESSSFTTVYWLVLSLTLCFLSLDSGRQDPLINSCEGGGFLGGEDLGGGFMSLGRQIGRQSDACRKAPAEEVEVNG